jgi:plasmid maintenance system antidote protein VapI
MSRPDPLPTHWINLQGSFDLKQAQSEAGARIVNEVIPMRQRA